jgi:hypothetical protein
MTVTKTIPRIYQWVSDRKEGRTETKVIKRDKKTKRQKGKAMKGGKSNKSYKAEDVRRFLVEPNQYSACQ